MIKLYKRDEQTCLHYHEAWTTKDDITEHWGAVGDKGQTRSHAHIAEEDEEAALERVLREARAKGFEEIDSEDHHILLIEYAVEGHGTDADVDKQGEIIARMDEALGWTGLGNADGGSIGSGTMEVCCFVVNFELARTVVAEDLKGTPCADYARIYDEGAE